MRRSIATVCLSGGIEEKLAAAAAAKFDAVEIAENDLLFFDGAVADVRLIAADLGLSILAFHSPWDFEAAPPEQFQRNLELSTRKLDIVGELGARMLILDANAGAQAIDDDRLAAEHLTRLAERAASRGIKIGYEAHASARHVRNYAKAWNVVRAAGHSHLGLVLNSFESLARSGDSLNISHIPGEKIFLVHVADSPKVTADATPHIQCFPGQGDLDVTGFGARVIEAGYNGPFSLEVSNDHFRAASAIAVARDGMRSLLFLEEQIRLRARAPDIESRRSDAAKRVTLFDPPPCQPLDGVAFLEFAVGSGDHELGAWLEGLGFSKTGVHRNKNVTLYQQGDIAIALNTEKDSFASSYYLVHGPSVCALGLRTPDPAALLSRAEAFGCPMFEERVGSKENPMPGFSSPDGALFYAVDEGFDAAADFTGERKDAADTGCRLRRVDHVGQALPEGRLETWLLFYRALFGLTPQERWTLLDPHGSVKSRALSNDTRTVRFPMTTSQGPRTIVARSLQSLLGSGVNQIAFATDDIFAAASAMAERGVPLLPIPANYYGDLAARFALPDTLVQAMQEASILYDRDESGGEFFHFYTQTFNDRFFFEIVQRKGGYDHYGAANAAVRMAAQSRVSERFSELSA